MDRGPTASTQYESQPEEAVRSPIAPRLLAGVTTLVVLLTLHAAPALATPSTSEIEAKRQELDAARSELDRLSTEMSMMVEEYNTVIEALDETRRSMRETERELSRAEADVKEAEAILGMRAAEIYKRGNVGFLEVLLDTTSFEDFLVRLDWFSRVSEQDAHIVADVTDRRDEVEDLKRALESREQEQISLRAEAESQKDLIEAAVSRQESFVASLDEEVQRLIAEEEERQRRLAEERAAQAAAAVRARLGSTDPSLSDGVDLDGPGHADVVAIALQYVGVPYVWGGSSPETGFDCSGLVKHCYDQVGVDLPRNSRAQFKTGTRIPPDRLDALVLGDLVFFGYGGDPSRVHHVGMYVGNGNFLHAPGTGDVVRVSSLIERIDTKGDYVGATRP
jgi:cell wall-associated NlpC family hydrolase